MTTTPKESLWDKTQCPVLCNTKKVVHAVHLVHAVQPVKMVHSVQVDHAVRLVRGSSVIECPAATMR